MLEVNKCPICLRTAVDYRHIELLARFSVFFSIPRCSLCYGVPPHHQTPEHRGASDQVKTLIELINYHLERSDRPNVNEPINWKAMTFAFSVHLKRFQVGSAITGCEKLGYPPMNERKLNELIEIVARSKIWRLEEVKDEVKLVKQHFQLELKLLTNQLGRNNEEEVTYFLRCGLERAALTRWVNWKTEEEEEEKVVVQEQEKDVVVVRRRPGRKKGQKLMPKYLAPGFVQTRSASKKRSGLGRDRKLIDKSAKRGEKARMKRRKEYKRRAIKGVKGFIIQDAVRRETEIGDSRTKVRSLARQWSSCGQSKQEELQQEEQQEDQQFGVHVSSSLFESLIMKSEDRRDEMESEVVFVEARKPRKGRGAVEVEPKVEQEQEVKRKPYAFRFQTQLQMKQQRRKHDRSIEIFVNGQETLDVDRLQPEIRPTLTFTASD